MEFELLADNIKQINDKVYWSSFFVTLCSINTYL